MKCEKLIDGCHCCFNMPLISRAKSVDNLSILLVQFEQCIFFFACLLIRKEITAISENCNSGLFHFALQDES